MLTNMDLASSLAFRLGATRDWSTSTEPCAKSCARVSANLLTLCYETCDLVKTEQDRECIFFQRLAIWAQRMHDERKQSVLLTPKLILKQEPVQPRITQIMPLQKRALSTYHQDSENTDSDTPSVRKRKHNQLSLQSSIDSIDPTDFWGAYTIASSKLEPERDPVMIAFKDDPGKVSNDFQLMHSFGCHFPNTWMQRRQLRKMVGEIHEKQLRKSLIPENISHRIYLDRDSQLLEDSLIMFKSKKSYFFMVWQPARCHACPAVSLGFVCPDSMGCPAR